MSRIRLLLVAALLVVTSCAKPEDRIDEAAQLTRQGEFTAAESVLRGALERHPDHVGLLVAMAEFYLQPIPKEHYKPRLALHYAMRADRAAGFRDPAAASVLLQAYRATGGSAQGWELIQAGLELVGHPDALNPKRLQPADPDLLEPTVQNVLEQRRREKLRAQGSPLLECPEGSALVDQGRYPSPHAGGEIAVDAVCIELPPEDGVVERVQTSQDMREACFARNMRRCTPDEHAVACGPLASVLGAHPACGDALVVRCCERPLPTRP